MPAHENNPSPIDAEVKNILANPSEFPIADWPTDELPNDFRIRLEARRQVGINWPTIFSEALDKWIFDRTFGLSKTVERQERVQEAGDVKLLLGHDEWQAWQYYISQTPHFRRAVLQDDPWFGRSVYQGVELFHVDRKSLWLFL
jgi:hypothetical protein